MKFVLVLVLLNSAGQPVSSSMGEFDDKDACEYAKVMAIRQVPATSTVSAQCYPKATKQAKK